MHGAELRAQQQPAWAPSAEERWFVGGAQVETPGGMKGKNGAVTSTYHLHTAPPTLCRTIWPHLLPVQCVSGCVQSSSLSFTVHPKNHGTPNSYCTWYLTIKVERGPKNSYIEWGKFKLVGYIAPYICWKSYVLCVKSVAPSVFRALFYAWHKATVMSLLDSDPPMCPWFSSNWVSSGASGVTLRQEKKRNSTTLSS